MLWKFAIASMSQHPNLSQGAHKVAKIFKHLSKWCPLWYSKETAWAAADVPCAWAGHAHHGTTFCPFAWSQLFFSTCIFLFHFWPSSYICFCFCFCLLRLFLWEMLLFPTTPTLEAMCCPAFPPSLCLVLSDNLLYSTQSFPPVSAVSFNSPE